MPKYKKTSSPAVNVTQNANLAPAVNVTPAGSTNTPIARLFTEMSSFVKNSFVQFAAAGS